MKKRCPVTDKIIRREKDCRRKILKKGGGCYKCPHCQKWHMTYKDFPKLNH